MHLTKTTLTTLVLACSTLVAAQDSIAITTQTNSTTFGQILNYVSTSGNATFARNVVDDVLNALDLFAQQGGSICSTSLSASTPTTGNVLAGTGSGSGSGTGSGSGSGSSSDPTSGSGSGSGLGSGSGSSSDPTSGSGTAAGAVAGAVGNAAGAGTGSDPAVSASDPSGAAADPIAGSGAAVPTANKFAAAGKSLPNNNYLEIF